MIKKYLQNYEISERSRTIVVHRSQFPKNGVGKKRESVVTLAWTYDGPDIYAVTIWCLGVQQADHSEKYLQNYEISERSRRIVVLRSHIPKNQGKKRESVANCNIDVGWYWLHEYSMKDKKSRNFAPR